MTVSAQRLALRAIPASLRHTGRVNAHDRLVETRTADRRSIQEIREDAVRDERLRMSRELHDGIAAYLVSLGYLLDELSAADDPASISAMVATATDHVEVIRAELRRTLDELRESGGNRGDHVHGGASEPVEVLVSYAEEVGRRSGLDVRIDRAVAKTRRLPSEVTTELTRSGREAITNVVRHANARTLWLTVIIEPTAARVVVADDGIGTQHPGSRPGRYGLAIMAERAERIGVIFRVHDRPGGGTVVTVSITEGHSR